MAGNYALPVISRLFPRSLRSNCSHGTGQELTLNQNGGHLGAKCDPWYFSFFLLNMSSLKFLSNCRYIASPFANVQDLSWRLLLRKLGVHLCFTSVEKTFDNPIKTINIETNTRDDFSGISTTKQDDRPLIVQVRYLDNFNACSVARSTAAPWV